MCCVLCVGLGRVVGLGGWVGWLGWVVESGDGLSVWVLGVGVLGVGLVVGLVVECCVGWLGCWVGSF